MPATDTLPELTTEQLAELSDRMKAAKQERANRERAEQGRRQLLRRSRAKLARVCSEITKTEAELSDKRLTVRMLTERAEGFEEMNLTAPEVRDERTALLQALTWATDEGINITAGVHVPSNARPVRALADASPHGLNWSVPLNELGRRLEALTEERERLKTRLSELEEARRAAPREDRGAGV